MLKHLFSSNNTRNGGTTATTAKRTMMAVKGAACCALALGAVIGGTQSAHAQSGFALDKRYSVKLGLYVPASDEVRRAGSDRMFTVEGEYRLQSLLEANSTTNLSVGYTQNNNFRMVPFTISQTFRDRGSSTRYYYGAGLGLYATTLDTDDTSARTKLLFGGFIVAGIDIGGPFFLEGKYHLISPYDRKGVSGLQATVGFRF